MRKKGFENFLLQNEHQVYSYKNGNIYVVNGAKYNDTEFHIAEKLAKSGQIVMFPNQGEFGKGRKNDVYLYDTKTYFPHKVELKSLFGNTAESVKNNLICGSEQANVIAYDIQSNIKINWLVEGLRTGWNSNLKFILLNWKGLWYEINSKILFDKKIYDLLK